MNIIVCIKQVPDAKDVRLDPKTNTMAREGVESIMNPFDRHAVEEGVRLKEQHGGTVTVLSMGPPQAEAILREAVSCGADEAVLVSDRAFAGADTWATALTLSAAIRPAVPDFSLIMMGKQAIDGDTAQVGPEVAEILSLPQITYGVEIRLTPNKKRIRVKRETENGYEVLEARLPAMVSASKGEPIRRVPSFQDVLNARLKAVSFLSAADLDLDETELGLKGSYTQVVKVFPPRQKQGGIKFEDVDPEVGARKIAAFLREEGFI